MAYDIPPPLKHKEKIFYSLNWLQLIYSVITFIIVFATFTKLPLPFQFSLSIVSVEIIIAIFFIRFDGLKRTKDFIKHLKTQKIETNSDALKKIINIKSIKDGTIHTTKQKLAILEITPINFLIKTKDEQETIIKGFQKFLNSLDFPVQIHISSHKINLENHFNFLKAKTKKYLKLFTSYKEFIEKSLIDKKIKNRKFYLIIPEKDTLDIQVDVCTQKLASLGLKVKRLSDKPLLNLFYNYVANKTPKQLKAGQIVKNYTHHLLSPKNITFYHDFFEVDKQFCRILAVKGYPHSVEMGFLDKIVSSGENYDISVHIEPYPIEDTMIQLNRELQKQQSDLHTDSQKGIINPSLEIKYRSTRKVLEELQKGQQKLFNVSLYIMCKGKTKEDAGLLSKRIKADLDGLMIQSLQPMFQMQHGYESMLPLGRDPLKIKRNIHTEGLSAFFPFSSPFLDIDNDGILLGLNKNNIPYIKNVFGLTNANGIILATSGAGKSYFTKLLISRQHLSGCDIIIIDPQGEYLAITNHYKGETITISKDSDTMINPLDLMGHEYLEKRLSLMDLFKIMFGDITEVQKALLDRAADLTYGRKGINRDDWTKKPPILQDLYKTLLREKKKASKIEQKTYTALITRLGMYAENGVFSFLNRQTNIDFSKNFVCFNIGSMPKQVKPVIMYLVLDYVYQRMKKSLRRKILVIDEAWAMLQTAEESSYVFEIVKTCRKYNLGLLMITQDVADLVSSKAGHAVLANTSYTFLLRQKPAVIRNVSTVFNLSQTEKDYLVTAQKGQGVLILENEHQELSVIASEKEHELITTNPDEMIQKGEKKKGKVKDQDEINITLDIEQDVHPAENLSIEDQNFLVNNEYVKGSFRNLFQVKQLDYFVKIRKPESALHTFYVDQIFQLIKKHTNAVKKYRTERPDIIFTNNKGKEIAIEVETGIKAKFPSKKKTNNEKFAKVKQKFPKRSYIFLPRAVLKNSYKRHEIPLIFRKDIEHFVMSNFSFKKKYLPEKKQGRQNAKAKVSKRKSKKSGVTTGVTKLGGKHGRKTNGRNKNQSK
jgi:conjugal transfer ATP-binding protein TraC